MMLIYAVGRKHMTQEEDERQIAVGKETGGVRHVAISILGWVVIRQQNIQSRAAAILTDIAVGANSDEEAGQRVGKTNVVSAPRSGK